MNDGRVILVTVAWPGGNADIGVRSDITLTDLADQVGAVLGVAPATATAQHWTPPRPGGPPGRRSAILAGVPFAELGVVDGDIVVFTETGQYPETGRGTAGERTAGERGMAPHD